MDDFSAGNDDPQLQLIVFSDAQAADSDNFLSPTNLEFLGEASSLSNVELAESRNLLSRRNSFSFDLEQQDAALSLKFESPKHVRPVAELHTAATQRDDSPPAKRFNFADMFTRDNIGSLAELPQLDASHLQTECVRVEIWPAERRPNNRGAPHIETLVQRPESPQDVRGTSRVRKIRKKRHDGCSCKNSNCLRLHCACFKELGYCKPTCRCDNCLNKTEFNRTRNFAIEKTKYIFSNAFNSHQPVAVVDVHGRVEQVNPRGCNCKSGCARNYCDCRKVNGKCSYICKCDECNNDKVELSREEIMKIYKPNSRKKHKLVINFKQSGAAGRANIIEFQTYQGSK